jgi:hypothetical protein
VSALSEGGWNILRTETRTSPISRENCCNRAQQARSRRAHQTRPKDNIHRNCCAAWSGAIWGSGDDGDFGISESLFPVCLRIQRNIKTDGNCSLIHVYGNLEVFSTL